MFILENIKDILFLPSIKYKEFEEILDFVPNNFILHKNLDFNNISSKFYKNILDSITYFIKNNYDVRELKNLKFIISLSGGVDSMVLTSLLNSNYLLSSLKNNNINIDSICISAVHINYNNREETVKEQKFLELWCKLNNINIYIKEIKHIKRGEINRSEYEKITQNIRYDFYKEIIELEKSNFIIFGHHKDDIIENIFANLCRGRSLLNLASMSSETKIQDVNIFRPMLNINKEMILNCAEKLNIPYFKNSTPDWSIRGKFRNEIYPLLINTFGDQLDNNLLYLNQQSEDWNKLLNNEIIEKFMDEIIFREINSFTINLNNNIRENFHIKFNYEKYKSYSITFWTTIFQKLFHKYHKSTPSRKALQGFLNSINNSKITFISLSNLCNCKIINNIVYIQFK